EEEFGFEPVSPAMLVTAQAVLDASERPPTRPPRFGAAATPTARVAAATCSPPKPCTDPPPVSPAAESVYRPGGPAPNGEPLYDFPASGHHLIAEAPIRT